MEGRALSAKNFPAFAETVVPYLNVASHLEGVPYDDLLQEKGFGGYPTLAFMDADGNVIGKPNDRTVAAFVSARDALMKIGAVRAKAIAGDPKAQVELLFLEFAVGNMKAAELNTKIKELADHASPAQLAKAKQIDLDARIYDLYIAGFRDPKGGAHDKLAAMLRAGELPTPGSLSCNVFWSTVGSYAKKTGDRALLLQVVDGLRSDLADDQQSQDMAAEFEKVAKGLEERDTLVDRMKAGESKLEAQILLIEVRLGTVTFESVNERLPAALAVATDEEKAELKQASVDLEVNSLISTFWMSRDRDPIYVRLFELLEENDTPPSEGLVGLLSMPVSNFARGSKDPDVLEAHAAAIQKRYGPESPMQALVKTLNDAAAKLR